MKLTPIRANMTEIETKNMRVLFSYTTPVACIGYHDNGDCFVYRTDQFFSKTTSKHINKFLEGKSSQTQPQSFFDNLV